jgi:hypothetical protein
MANDAGTQVLRIVLEALKGRGFAERFERGSIPMAPITGVPAFSLKSVLPGDPHTLTLETAFHVEGGRFPGTIRFSGHPLRLKLTRNDNGEFANRQMEYRVRQLEGDDITILIPPASILSEIESAAADISRS